MKTELQKTLATVAPLVSIDTHWEPDTQTTWDVHPTDVGFPGNAMDDEDPDDWTPWNAEVRATAIVAGDILTGSAYLGGTWEKYGDNPAVSNQTISGYENQMTREALEELRVAASTEAVLLCDQIAAALDYLKTESRRSYDAQRAEIEASR